ncbi:MAG: dolichyl-phosphate-mannose-protein mannosyltransferase [Clostridiaceae bacterium]|jgi:4-amino-4-deoxy-L-arabinose transferase-like glycosyltransferase|nr:dolichyl-phosphate-mannose-protein mannosyltransferase [Clostridiaceae bacterium]
MKKKLQFTRETLWLSLILMLSAILNLANLSVEGYANTYYAAGVKSMLMSFKNFFFVAFDPSGFVTIDKPPLGFWIQTISAKIFGFSGWSIILPQAIAGVISVWLIYHLVERSFGSLPALISALCLAVTPIFVAASRNNTIDNLLVLALLLACWAILIAAEKGSLKYLIISLAIVGIGFNIKMAEAYLVAPALYITYLLSSSIPLKKRIKHLILGTIVLILVSLSWSIAVDLVLAANRPFIGSSTNNSVMELIMGHNGFDRIGLGSRSRNSNEINLRNQSQGQRQTADNFSREKTQGQFQDTANLQNRNRQFTNNAGFGGMGNSSKAGITRLFANNNISDQISWLLPFALFGFLAAKLKEKSSVSIDDKRRLSLIMWFMWLLPECIYFSFTKGSFHTYYLTTMAPSISALTGIGLVTMWEFFKESDWKSWLLPSAFIVNAAVEILILSYNYGRSSGYKAIIFATAILSVISSIALAGANIVKQRNNPLESVKIKKLSNHHVFGKALVSAAFIGIILAPIVWSFTPMFYKMNGSSPSAGLELASNRQMQDSSIGSNSKLIKFLESNRTNEKYLVAVPSAQTYASDLILETGEPVMTIGGFSGSDKIITLSKFKQLVANGEIRYAIVNGDTGPNAASMLKNNSSNNISNWIQQNGKLVPGSEWKNTDTTNSGTNSERISMFGGRNSVQLYDLK